MIKGTALVILLLSFVAFTKISPAQQRPKPRDFDDPAEEADLNRELWEFARHTPYKKILPYVRAGQRNSRATQVAEVELPNGWRINPAGKQLELGRLPYEAVFFAGRLVVLDTGYYYHEPQEVSIVDVKSEQVLQTLRINSLFPSAAVGDDGYLYISGGYDQKVYRIDRNFKIDKEFQVNGFAGGLAFIDPKHLAVGYMATKGRKGNYVAGKIAILNVETGTTEQERDLGYFPYAVKFLRGRLYITLVGEHKLLVLKPDLTLLKTMSFGRHPLQMCDDGDRLYVVNSSSDSLTVIDARDSQEERTISVARPGSRFGVAPTSCSVDNERLYVTLSGTNAVAVIDKKSSRTLGLVPTGWLPTRVLTDEKRLLVLSAKGVRARRPNPNGPQANANSRHGDYVLTLLKGSLSIIEKSDLNRDLTTWTSQVESGSPIFSAPSGFKLPIGHIFYVIKENRTYDQVLGDLGRGNGDPKLTLFDSGITPVEHQLAREFVTLDNFFVNGEVSVLGHAYTTAGYSSPFSQWMAQVEYSGRWKGGGYSTSPAVEAPTYLWDRLNEKGIDYRFYGEDYFLFNRSYRIIVDNFGAASALAKKFYARSLWGDEKTEHNQEFHDAVKAFYGKAGTREAAFDLLGHADFALALSQVLVGDDALVTAMAEKPAFRRELADCLYRYPLNFPSWDLRISDLERVRAWKTDFAKQLESGTVPPLEYIWLPNDHTDGNSHKILDPFQFVAQNDAALGALIATISQSPIWKDSLILVVEDDAQNGPDHVDATRTIAFAAGPYVKRGAVVSDRYDQLSMLRTIEVLLGLEPINLGDRMAAPMFGIFTDQPDFRPFAVTEVSGRLAPEDRERYLQLQAANSK